MKINLPVTGVERHLTPGRPIVSKTDLKGVVTYCNKALLDISGFSRDEMIGHSQNILRHPDIPPEVFADLWRTIQSGHPWRGVVKNRAKNGDHYWVDAYVTPITSNGASLGYMSVRTVAKPEEVRAAEALFKAIREKQAKFPKTPLATGRSRAVPLVLGTASAIALLAVAAAVVGGGTGLAFGLGSALLTLGSGLVVVRRLLTPMRALALAVQNIDEGQVDQAIISPGGVLDDAFAKLESLRIHLRAMFADVLVSAAEVADRSCTLDQSMHRLSESSETQTENVMRVSAAMEEMSVAIAEISRNTETALSAARKTEEAANSSMQAMSESIDSSNKAIGVVSRFVGTHRRSQRRHRPGGGHLPDHSRHCRSDQPAGLERCHRSGARRRTGTRLCRGCR